MGQAIAAAHVKQFEDRRANTGNLLPRRHTLHVRGQCVDVPLANRNALDIHDSP